MKKQTAKQNSNLSRVWRLLSGIVVVLIIIAGLVALSIWVLWPVREKHCRTNQGD